MDNRSIGALALGLGALISPLHSAHADDTAFTGGVRQTAPGKVFNPDVSVNFLGLAQHGNLNSQDRASENPDGIQLQEAEIQFLSDVDPYFRASALFSIAPNSNREYSIEPEEVFAETTFLPVVTLKGGKFKAALGKHNQLHTHAFPFIDEPLINTQLLGPDQLEGPGVSAAALLPTNWFSELTVQAISNSNEALYNSPRSGDYAGVAQWRNLLDVTDETTLELAVYGTSGANQWNSTSQVEGADLIAKYRPAEGGKYHAVWFTTEYLHGNRGGDPAGEHLGGIASWLQYQVAERWWVQGRGELTGIPDDGTGKTQKQSALVGFFPSEFSGFRLQYDHLTGSGYAHDGHNIAFQMNFTIGAHPAHAY